MALSPDDIERRTFSIVAAGYDPDEVAKFLFDVAATLRVARHTTQPPVAIPGSAQGDLRRLRPAAVVPTDGDHPVVPAARPPATRRAGDTPRTDDRPAVSPATSASDPTTDGATDPGDASDASDAFSRLGAEVADVLRLAHDAAAQVRAQAEAEATEIRADAELDAREVRRTAEADAAWHQDRAKRVLTTAQEQADAIVGEAENQARAIVLTATETTEEHVRQVTDRARRHVDDVLRTEREALERLRSAQADVARAIEAVARSGSRPDLSVGPEALPSPLGILAAPEAPPPSDATLGGTVGPGLGARDPLVRMVRQAVDRAVDAAATVGPDPTDPIQASDAVDDGRAAGPPEAHADGDGSEADQPALAGSQPPSLH